MEQSMMKLCRIWKADLMIGSKSFAQWQVEIYYPSVYNYYNNVYRKIYRTDMPFNKFYAGPLKREGLTQDPMDFTW